MSTRTLAAIAIAGPVIFALAVLVQDVIQYDYLVANGDDPWTTSPVSVNALGPYGWVQTLNFGVMGLLYLLMWRRMRQSPGWEAFGRYSLVMGVLTLPLEVGSIAMQQVVAFSWFYLWLGAHLVWCVLLGLRLWHAALPARQA